MFPIVRPSNVSYRRVLAADPERDVAILWIDSKVAASVRPIPLGCQQAASPPVVDGQEIFTIAFPLRQQKGITPGNVSRVDAQRIVADFRLAQGGSGGPVFRADRGVVGITSVVDENDDRRGGTARVDRARDVCDVVAFTEQKI